MKLSELIKQLQEIEKMEGDIDCYAYDQYGDLERIFEPICHYFGEPDGTQKKVLTIFTI